MKRNSSNCFLSILVATLLSAVTTFGQTNTTGTNLVVTITAPDPSASEAGDPGLFTVSRGTNTTGNLPVFLFISGTALNGVDYQAISNRVIIADGATSASIAVIPIDDMIPEPTESVVVRVILPPNGLFPYRVGSPNTATVTIADNDGFVQSNHPPVVSIVHPLNNSFFPAPANISIRALAEDFDGFVASVEFFADNQSLGFGMSTNSATNSVGTVANLFFLTWSNVPPGAYDLTAKATDDDGAMRISPMVHIFVGTNQPPPTNQLAIVNISATDPTASEGRVSWCSNTVFGVNWWWGTNAIWRTNWPCPTGTNTAKFTVRRSGSTNDPLRVFYSIGGTASNGVDYEELSGEVTIPAGRRAAHIVVTPIDDTLSEGIETVVLRLRLPPDPADTQYIIGRPASAAAYILDNDRQPPPCVRLPDGTVHLCTPFTNLCFRVELSTNLINWEGVCTNRIADGAAHHLDPDATNCLRQFIRFIPVPCPPDDE